MNQLKKYSVLALASVGLIACSDPDVKEVKQPIVSTYTIPVKSHENVQNFPAIVKASDYTELSFRVSGELVDVLVQNGQTVKKGQLLAKLDPTNYQLTVNDKKSKTELAKKSRDRAAKMVELGNMAQSVLDELDATYRVLSAEYAYAKLQLSYVELRAPFEGVIANVPVDNFQSTAVGETVITMHSKEKVEIKVSLPDFILSASRQNADKSKYIFDVSLDAYPDHTFNAKYKEHTVEQTNENKKYVLILEMPIDKERITLEGMPGSIKLDLARLNMKKVPVHRVPVESVILPDYQSNDGLERTVWRLLPDNTVEPVSVRAQNFSSHSLLNVSGDLNDGDVIITQGMFYLTEGMEVKTMDKGVLAE